MTLHDVHILDKINQNKTHTIHEKAFVAKNKYRINLPTETLIDYFYKNK
jgi:hypothetical protein